MPGGFKSEQQSTQLMPGVLGETETLSTSSESQLLTSVRPTRSIGRKESQLYEFKLESRDSFEGPWKSTSALVHVCCVQSSGNKAQRDTVSSVCCLVCVNKRRNANRNNDEIRSDALGYITQIDAMRRDAGVRYDRIRDLGSMIHRNIETNVD